MAVLGQLVHSLALYGAVEALHLGATLHLLDGVRPDRQARALAERRIALVYATPAQMRALVAAGVDWPDLRQVIIGGAKLDPALRAELQTRSPAQVVEFYGAAETSFISLSDAATPPDSVGRPYPGVEIEDRDGLLWVRSPYLAQGYAGVPGSALWQDGWVCPGEIGHLAEGYLYLTGRAGRRVKIADQTVQPEEIEALILSLPGVQAAAVLPQPDARRGWCWWPACRAMSRPRARSLPGCGAIWGRSRRRGASSGWRNGRCCPRARLICRRWRGSWHDRLSDCRAPQPSHAARGPLPR
ncbi:AMP-binding protein [Gemmobacter lanyuensis]